MAKSRDKLQQVGFWDEEVSKPGHDDVVQWAYRNAEYIFRAACPTLFDRQWTLKDVGWFSPSDEEPGREAAETFMAKTLRPNPQIKRKWLEQVISTQTDHPRQQPRMLGFADLVLHTVVPVISPKGQMVGKTERWKLGEFEVQWQRYPEDGVLVEAKSVLPTLGELMRQIRTYQLGFHGPAVVVGPDGRHAQMLQEQGVAFVLCPADMRDLPQN